MTDVTKLAFNLFADIESADDPKSVGALLIDGFERLGFNSVVSVKIPGANEDWESNLLINTRSDRFAEAYFGYGYDTADPVLDHFQLHGSAFEWLEAYRRSQRDTALQLYQLTERYNMRNGLAVPILTATSGGIVSASCISEDIDRDRFSAAHLIALYAGTKMLAPCQTDAQNLRLHPREYECLQWVAVGKTDTDIARILSLSPNTVRNYIERAKDRLGAPNRTSAVVRALKEGLLSL
ncbi:MAG: LuxR C-terminal-related transcriptional regulator [Pseudomonadota bacterium]